MVDRGLLDLHSVFKAAYAGIDRDLWVKPVQTVRRTIIMAAKKPPVAVDLLNTACEIALEFGEDWRLPIAVHLLAVLPHGLNAYAVYKGLCT